MRDSFFGFSRSEVMWFAFFFVSTIIIMAVSSVRLINKYYSNNKQATAEIKKYSSFLLGIHEIDHYAVTIQRGSLNLIIYSGDPAESKIILKHINVYRDSLSLELGKLLTEKNEKETWNKLEKAGSSYLARNEDFLIIGSDSTKKEEAADYNVNVMRPTLRVFTDMVRSTGQRFTQRIKESTDREINIALQVEFWLLVLALLPYVYFFFRFLYLVIKMIVWDISLKK
jgi:hypothetical protein